MTNCKECGVVLTHKNTGKTLIRRCVYCSECLKTKRLEYVKSYNKMYSTKKNKTKLQQKQEPKYNVMTIEPREVYRLLAWFENAYFKKFGKKYKALNNFGGNW